MQMEEERNNWMSKILFEDVKVRKELNGYLIAYMDIFREKLQSCKGKVLGRTMWCRI